MSNVQQFCVQCGAGFTTAPLQFEGRVIATQRYCESCITRRDHALRQERDQRERARLEDAWEKICPPLFRDTDPDRLPCSRAAREAVLGWQFGSRGLLVGGPPRLGKTRLLYVLLSRIHFTERRKISALSATAFSHHVSARFSEGGGKGESFVEELAAVPVLFIDDIGKGRLTERVEAEFFHIIDVRTTHLRPTLLTTNLNGQAFASMWSADRSEALLGRFREFFQPVTVLGADDPSNPEAKGC
jgi:hypothetical protein